MAGGSTQWQGRSVISKALALLDAFSPATPDLSLGDIARNTGLPMSTTYRLACELVAWGGLEHAAGGSGYRIGGRLRELGALAPHPVSLHEVALPYLHDLHESTREMVHLAVLDGREARYAETVAGRIDVPVPSRRGARVPLHATAGGKVLLAHAPEALLQGLFNAGLRRYTPNTLVAPGPLRRALAEVRRTGIACAREEMRLGSQSVAAPVVGRDGSVVAAIAVVLPSGRGDLRRLGAAARTAAISASRSLQEQAGADQADPRSTDAGLAEEYGRTN